MEDYRCTVDCLVTLDYVDEDRIGLLGICGGGGYSIPAAMTDRRFKAVGTVAAVNFGRMLRENGGKGNPIEALEAVAKQRTAEARRAEPLSLDYLASSPEEARRQGITDPDILEATEYYKTPRGQAPNGCTKYLLSHQAAAFAFDAFSQAEHLLTQPLQIIAGDIPGAFGSYRDSFDLFNRARSEKKDLLILPNCSHYDLYWKPESTDKALAKLIPFYQENL